MSPGLVSVLNSLILVPMPAELAYAYIYGFKKTLIIKIHIKKKIKNSSKYIFFSSKTNIKKSLKKLIFRFKKR